jgi:gliding motility-associated-like protein
VATATGGAGASFSNSFVDNPNVTFTSTGTVGTVVLKCTVTNNNKCSAEASTFTITVNRALAATASGGSTSICSGTSPGTFTATATGGNGTYSYQWYNSSSGIIGGATSSSYTAPTLTANTSFYCDVTSGGGCGSVTTNSIVVTVTSGTSATISGGNTNICYGTSPGTFTANASGGNGTYSYQWYNSSGAIGSATSSTYTAPTLIANNGYYVVVTGSCGTITTSTTSITVKPQFTVSISGGTTPICTGNSPGSFTVTASGGSGSYTYQWYNGSGLINGSTASTYTAPVITADNEYYASVTDGGGCGTISTPAVVIVVDAPTVTAGGAIAAICQGGTTAALGGTFGGTATGAVWTDGGAGGTFSNNGGSTPNTATYTAASNSSSPVTLTLTSTGGACGTASATNTVTVNENPTVTAGGPVAAVCQGGTTTALGGSFGGGASTATWTDGGVGGTFANNTGTTPGTTTYTAGANSPASVTLTLTTQGGSCGSASATQTLTVNPNPTVNVGTATADICQGGTTAGLGGSFGGGATSAVWSDGGAGGSFANNSGSTPATTTYTPLSSVTGTVTLTLTSGGGVCGTTSASKTITVNPNPTVNAGPAMAAICQGGTSAALGGAFGGGATLATWDDGGAGGSFANNGGSTPATATYTASNTAPATVTLTLTTFGGSCGVVTASKTISINPLPLANAGAATAAICQGGTTAALGGSFSGGATGAVWSDGGAGGTFANNGGITPGTAIYTASASSASPVTLTLTTSGGVCGITTASKLITVNQNPVISSITNSPALCNGSSTGTIVITAIDGLPAYSYSIDSGAVFQASNTFSGLPAGNDYVLEVSDANGCYSFYSHNDVTITQPIVLTQTDSSTKASCANVFDGSIIVTAAGGISPYSYSLNGGPSQPGNTFSNLGAAAYVVQVTDFNGCTDTAHVTITNSYAVSDSLLSQTNVSCFGGADGALTVQLTGGVPTYSYSDNGSTFQLSPTFTGLSAGNYVITLRDSRGCTDFITTTVTQPAVLDVLIDSIQNDLCSGQSQGAIYITVTGGNIPYSYSWSNSATTQNVTNLTAGTYNVTILDSKGCNSSSGATITQPLPLFVNVASASNLACYKDSAGHVYVSVSGGVPPYTYNWSNGATTEDISGLGAGTYTLTVLDANSCSATVTQTISQPTQLTSTISATNVTCNGAANGSVTFSASGGVTPYTYLWNNGATTQSLTGISGGFYSVVVKDANGCSITNSITVTEPAALVLGISSTNASCNGSGNATVTTTVSGGTGTITYLWSNGATTANLTNVAAGNYSVVATDANSCSASAIVTVAQPTALVLNGTVANVLCSGGSDGSVSITVNGGVAPYTYLWSNGATTQNINGVVANTYTVTATDANLCTVIVSFNVTSPAALTSSIAGTNVTCHGQGNGTATLTAGGGTTPYSFNWSNFQATQNLVGLSGGTYYVTITDANGCTRRDSVIILEPAAIVLGISSTDVSCNGGSNGSVTTTVSGGTGTITYLWSNGATTASLTNVVAATYSVVITDANSCTASASATITQPSALAINGTAANVSCFGGSNGSVAVTVNGGVFPYTYAWTNGATTQDINGVVANTYTVTATDANLCSITASFTVGSPTAITSSVTGTNVTCHGEANGTATLTVSGGTTPYTFNWSNFQATQNLTGLSGGTYYVIITDANGCTRRDSVIILEPAAIVLGITSTNVNCNGSLTGSVTTTVSGGTGTITYLWSNGATTANLTNVGAATYSVIITDANSCTASASATVTQPTALVINGTVADVLCSGGSNGSVAITVNGGVFPYSYAWSNGATTQNINGVVANTYTVTATDANLCNITASFNVTSPTPIVSSVTGTNVTCHGQANGTATLTVSGGTTPYSYLWSNFQATQNLTGLSGGIYYVIITDANGCSKRDSVTILEPAAIVLGISSTDVSCNGGSNGSVTTTVSGGTGTITYLWSNGATTASLTNVVAATYSVIITDANSCTASASATVSQPTALVLNGTAASVSCSGGNNGSVAVTVNGGVFPYSYAWSNGATTQNINGVVANTYTVTATDANLCTVTGTFTVTSPSPIVSSVTGTNVTCHGEANGTATLTVSGGTTPYTFSWSNFQATQNLTGLSGGTYYVIITDANGCTKRDSVIITEPAAIVLGISNTNVSCNGGNNGSVTTTVSGGTGTITYLWSNGATTANITNATATNYSVTITDANLCTASASATVTQPTALVINGTIDSILCAGGNNGSISITVNGGVFPYSYAWSTGATTQNVNNLAGGVTYTVTATDANLCTITASFNVTSPTALVTSITGTNVTCHGAENGTASVTVSGGTSPYNYLWSNFRGTATIDSLNGGLYFVIVTDHNGCPAKDSVNVSEPSQIVITSAVTQITCFNQNNGSITLTITGGVPAYTYTWNPTLSNSGTQTNLAGANYLVTVTDVNNCSASAQIDITNPPAIAVNDVVKNPKCYGDSNGMVNLITSGGVPAYTYTWSYGSQTAEQLTNVPVGTYEVTVTDANGCSQVDTAVVSTPSLLYTSGVVKNVSCFGAHDGAVLVTVYGGTLPYTFNWSPSGASTQDLYNLSGSSNTLVVTDNNGCQVSSLYNVHEPVQLTLGITGTNVTCFGGSNGTATSLPSGGTVPYRYLWSNFSPDSVQTGLPAGNYNLQLVDSDGCYAFDSVTISQPTQIQLTGFSNNVVCFNTATGSLDVIASGGTPGYTYVWSNGGVDSAINTLSAGVYTVTVTDTKNCSVSADFTVNQGTKVIIDLANYNPICYNGNTGAITALVSGGAQPYSYSWSSGASDTTVALGRLRAGTYTVTVTDNVGCSVTADATLIQPGAISISPSITGARCSNAANGVVIANATGGTAPFNYLLNGVGQSSDTFSHVTPGSYDLVATDVNGCQGTDTFSISTPNTISVTLTVTDQVIVTGMQTQLSASAVSNTPIIGYIWSPILIDSADVFDFSSCNDSLNCSTPYVKPPFTTIFTVTAMNQDSCVASDTVTVIVNASESPSFFPTAFTPNGDGLNDRFTFSVLGATTIETAIYDRWGQRVYYDAAQPNGISSSYGWDGTFGGKEAPQDTYVYQLKITYFDGTTKSKAGTVTLMR